MKHLLLLFTFTISLMVSGQITTFPYVQTFDGTEIPVDWSQVDNQGSGQIWQFGTITDWGPNNPALTGNYAFLNSDAYGPLGVQNADLVSPTFDFTGVSSVNLYFNHFFRYYDGSSATLSYSIDNGQNWVEINTWTNNSNNPEIFSQVIDAVAGQSEVKFKWNYTGQYGWGWAIDNVTVSELSEAIWTGAVDNDWHNSGNWFDNIVPDAASNVTIPVNLNNPVIGQDAVCANLTIATGAKVTITPGKSLTVLNVLTNEVVNGLVIESDASGTGSLIAGSTEGVGTFEIQRYMTGNQWHNVSSPVDQAIFEFLSNNANIPAKVDGSRGMTAYNTSSDTWNAYFTDATIEAFEIAKGYLLRTNANGTVKFNGPIYTGPQYIELSPAGNGWNLIGNPYTSAVCLNEDAGISNFLSYNEISLDPNFFSIYVWDGSEYQIINNASGAEYATIGQGFFVKNVNGTNADFTPAMQVHQPNAALKSKKIIPEIKLFASAPQKSASTGIKFIDGTTTGMDKGFDAGIFKSDPSFSVFTKLVDDNNVEFGLQCLPLPAKEMMTIPLGIDYSKGGEVTISALMSNLPSESKIIFEDRLLNKFVQFDNTKSAYTTTVAANTKGTGRFYLHIGNSVQTSIREIENNDLVVYTVDQTTFIKGNVSKNAQFTIYSVDGRIMGKFNADSENLNRFNTAGFTPGVYFVNVQDINKYKPVKFILSK